MLRSLIIASTERHGLNPQRCLTSVPAKLPFTLPNELEQVPARCVETRRRGNPRHRLNHQANPPRSNETPLVERTRSLEIGEGQNSLADHGRE